MICIVYCGDIRTLLIGLLFFLHRVPFRFCRLSNARQIACGADMQGIIIGGSGVRFTADSMRRYCGACAFVKAATVPVLGICFGHQVIGLLHGAQVATGRYIRGWRQVQLQGSDALFAGVPRNALWHQFHHDYISLPADFALLASSAECANEAMKHTSRPLYGVQFHPELSGAHGRRLLLGFARMCRQSTAA